MSSTQEERRVRSWTSSRFGSYFNFNFFINYSQVPHKRRGFPRGGGSLINSRWVCLKFLIFFPTDESRFHLGEKKEDEKSERFDELNVPFGFGMTSFDQAFDEVEGKTIFNKNSSFESNSGGGTQCCFNAQITLYGRGIG